MLFRSLAQYHDPLAAMAAEPVLAELDRRRRDDLSQALAQAPWCEADSGRIWLFPDAGWARRMTGPFANRMASDDPARAHAVARYRADGAIDISVRAPITRRRGADRLCAAFGGGGRAAAGAIEALPAERFEAFVQAFAAFRWGEPDPVAGASEATPPAATSG